MLVIYLDPDPEWIKIQQKCLDPDPYFVNLSETLIIPNKRADFCNDERRVVDPHWFNVDPDPAFFLNADVDTDLDPVSNPGVWWPKIEKNLQL